VTALQQRERNKNKISAGKITLSITLILSNDFCVPHAKLFPRQLPHSTAEFKRAYFFLSRKLRWEQSKMLLSDNTIFFYDLPYVSVFVSSYNFPPFFVSSSLVPKWHSLLLAKHFKYLSPLTLKLFLIVLRELPRVWNVYTKLIRRPPSSCRSICWIFLVFFCLLRKLLIFFSPLCFLDHK
jgi:hypothetical protein